MICQSLKKRLRREKKIMGEKEDYQREINALQPGKIGPLEL